MEPNETSLMMQQQLNVMSQEFVPNVIGNAEEDHSYDVNNMIPIRKNMIQAFHDAAKY